MSAILSRSKTLLERLRARTAPANEHGCMLWTWRVGRDGLARLSTGRVTASVLAHRVAWEAEFGEIPAHQAIVRTCGEPRCMNTAHMVLTVKGGDLATRFWSRVDKTERCWLWRGALKSCGYGSVNLGSGTFMSAHRLAWTLVRGPIPEGQFICHSCDVRQCVNPDHLFLGTHADNMADMRAKGRSQRGDSHAHAKLTAEDVKEIRVAHARGEGRASLARRFGVRAGHINKLVAGKAWRHVGGEDIASRGVP